jgi:hypothetical protein
MKFKLILMLAALCSFGALADTNTITTPTLSLTNAVEEAKSAGGWEVTLGGGGVDVNGQSEFGLDISVSHNPFESLPNLWFGIVQGSYWEPSFSGSTDLNVNWSSHLTGELYVNTGWSGGVVYDNDTTTDTIWRTGPEVTFQYYVGEGNAFIYAGVNYDFVSEGDNGFRYGFGIGLSF